MYKYQFIYLLQFGQDLQNAIFFFAFTFAIKDPNFFSSFHEYVELPLVYNTVLVLKDLGRLGKQW